MLKYQTVTFFILRLMDESVRWLLSNGRVDEAKRILKKAARWNNVDYKDIEAVLKESVNLTDDEVIEESIEHLTSKPPKQIEENRKDVGYEQDLEKYTVIDILKTPSLRINTFILWYSW